MRLDAPPPPPPP
ncbi:hypothetical protein D021_2756A, partial [Vibrio parahaemolyticus 10296]